MTIKTHGVAPLAVGMSVLLSIAAGAQTSPGGGATQPGPPSAAQSESTPGTPTRPSSQPSYPSSDPPRGTTPAQRQQQVPAGDTASNTRCNQEDELARSECLRRDMTDDDDLPAGVTRSMHERKQQQEESLNVATEADTGSDQARGRSRTRTASSDVPGTQGEEQDSGETEEAQAPESDANNASDTLGRER